MASPSSAKAKQYSYSTPKHDKIQLYISNNVRDVANTFYGKGDVWEIHENAYLKLEQERPIYNGYDKKYLLGIVDGFIDIHDKIHCSTKSTGLCNCNYAENKHTSICSSHHIVDWYKLEECPNIFRRIVYEIKPCLEGSLSQAIGQIKSYADYLEYDQWSCMGLEGRRKPRMLLVTLDNSSDYDSMLNSQGVMVYRVPRGESI